MDKNFLVGMFALLGTLIYISTVGMAQSDPILADSSGNGFHWEEADMTAGDLVNVTDGLSKYSNGVRGFESSLNNFRVNQSNATPPNTGSDITYAFAIQANSQTSSVPDDKLITFNPSRAIDILMNRNDGTMGISVLDCSSTFHIDYTPQGEFLLDAHSQVVVRVNNTDSGIEYDMRQFDANGTRVTQFTGTHPEPCWDNEADIIAPDNCCANPSTWKLYEERYWLEKVPMSDLKEWADPRNPRFDGVLFGTETAAWSWDAEGLEAPPPVPPEPVDFAEGIQDAAAAWGFKTSQSQMFFAIASTGLATVAVGTGAKFVRSGRNKNLLLAGVGFLIGVFFVLIGMLEFWMFTVAAIISGFALLGGPEEIRNTFREVREEARRALEGRPQRVEPEPDDGGLIVPSRAEVEEFIPDTVSEGFRDMEQPPGTNIPMGDIDEEPPEGPEDVEFPGRHGRRSEEETSPSNTTMGDIEAEEAPPPDLPDEEEA